MSLGGGPAVAQEGLSEADWFLPGIVGLLALIWLGHFPCSGDVTSLRAMVAPALIKEGAVRNLGRVIPQIRGGGPMVLGPGHGAMVQPRGLR